MERFLYCRSLSSLLPLGIGMSLGMSLAACGASVEDEAASGDVVAEAAGASAPTVSAQSYKGGASAHPGVVDASTAQQALTALTGNVDASISGFKRGVSSGAGLAAGGGNGAGATQSMSVPCAGGGAADVDGYMNMVAIDVNVAIAFSGCATPSGTMVDGNIEFSQTLDASPDATPPFLVETIYEGDVNLSGNVNVSCPVDLNVLVDETGRAVKVQGMFCNQDASALAMQLQPLWQNQ